MQNVHSNEQINASSDSGDKSLSQHSHPGLSSSIKFSFSLSVLKSDEMLLSVAQEHSMLKVYLDRDHY